MTGFRRSSAGALMILGVVLASLCAAGAAPQKRAAAPTPAAAAGSATQSLGKIDAWSAYTSQDKTGRVCYVVGQAHKSEPAGFARKPPMAMVTHRPAENITNVVSFVEGYPLKDGGDVALDVGGSKFTLFTKDDSAWARTSDLDKAIVAALAKGRQAVVKGTAQKGGSTIDVYSLAGFPKALALIDKACGVQREDKAKPRHPAPARHHKKKTAHKP